MTYIPVELKRRIMDLSGGCCEYCRVSSASGTVTFQFEHIIAESHGGRTLEQNLALSCPVCNRYKGPNIAAADPETGDPTFLFHPRRDEWDVHFYVDEAAVIMPRTSEGRVTTAVLHLNDPERVEYRQMLIVLGEYPCQKNS